METATEPKTIPPAVFKNGREVIIIIKKVLDHYLHHDLGVLPLLRCFFAHLLILQYPDHHQNLISSSLSYSGPVHKILSQSVHNVLSNVVHRQTNRQTDKLTNATKNITSFAKEVKIFPMTSLKNVHVRRHAFFSLKKIPADQSKFVLHPTTCTVYPAQNA